MVSFFSWIHNNIYQKIFTPYHVELERQLEGCKSILDVGCGTDSPVKYFSDRFYCAGVEVFGPAIEESKQKGIHKKYYQVDVLKMDKKIKDNSYDCVLASDLIEHLDKKDGIRLLKLMERIATKRIIIFTPNGFREQAPEIVAQNPYQKHKSGWSVSDMRKLGFRVIGINGLGKLRKARAIPIYRPHFFWYLFLNFTQFYTRNHPEKAYAILCVKDVKKK